MASTANKAAKAMVSTPARLNNILLPMGVLVDTLDQLVLDTPEPIPVNLVVILGRINFQEHQAEMDIPVNCLVVREVETLAR